MTEVNMLLMHYMHATSGLHTCRHSSLVYVYTASSHRLNTPLRSKAGGGFVMTS